ncbi:hypothetical protein BJ085DRAFT_30021 [Dimargaris cristalligena]|uniref:G-protein coupled receptors family 1 profile domain-containing protein n=1 Tax=Dimargaris cristalligena TaxID=215637 RepID=A0A4P9ZZD5_9FUNG|nr:hypothetical protein BJ085DRAFT_30021 [Dimargaris cristalligena]|eukprot:RKP38461.1 hypothetical protein BJ085DRAFT_30021 [Dimargaris cristalligena]
MAGVYGETEAFTMAITVIALISTVCCLVVMGLNLWVRYHNSVSKESPSFVLSFYIAMSILLGSLYDFLGSDIIAVTFPETNANARFNLWLTIFQPLWSIFFTAMIMLDLQLVFFHRLPRQARIRQWYPALATLIAFLLSMWSLITPDVRYGELGGVTIQAVGRTWTKIFQIWNSVWLVLGMCYILVMTIMICIKVFGSQAGIGKFARNGVSPAYSPALIRNTRLIMAYPITQLIAYMPSALSPWFLSYTDADWPWNFNLYTRMSLEIDGVFCLCIFLFHPVMLAAYKDPTVGLSSFWRRFSDKKSSQIPTYDTHTVSGKDTLSTFSDFTNTGGAVEKAHLIHTLDMGPKTTGLFDNAVDAGRTAHLKQGTQVDHVVSVVDHPSPVESDHDYTCV